MVTLANRPSSSTQHGRRSDINDSTLRRIKSPLSARPTAFDRQAPCTGTSPRDYRYTTACHRSVPGRPRSSARHHILAPRHYRYATECHPSVPGRPRSIARHHILAHRHATIATRPDVTDQSPARRSHHITPRHHSTDVYHRSDVATRRAALQTPGEHRQRVSQRLVALQATYNSSTA